MSEAAETKRQILKGCEWGSKLFRHNVGTGWTSNQSMWGSGRGKLTLTNPRPLQAGLCKGGSDIIGWTPVRITDEMVGQTVAVFTAVEIKFGRGVPAKIQIAFIRAVHKDGGLAGVSRNEDDLRAILDGSKEHLK